MEIPVREKSGPHVKKWALKGPFVWPACTVLAVIAAFLAVNPVLDMGINDDWAYARMSQLLVETGRLHFDGWTSPMVGVHAVWGALFIEAFGFSFTILRFSTVVTAAGCALVCHAICRGLGLKPAMSAFTAMALMLSPLAIAMTPTFMTDITGLFLFLLVLYCVLRCARASTKRASIGWLLATVCAGVLGGSVRQVLFLTAFSMIVSVMVVRWRSRVVVMAGIGALMCLGASAAALLSWQYAQPGAVHNLVSWPVLSWAQISQGAKIVEFVAVTVVALAMPILASALTIPAAWKKGGIIALLIAGLVLAAVVLQPPFVLIPPALGNVVTEWGGLPPGGDILGDKPVVLPAGARILFAAIMYVAAALVAGVGLHALRDRLRVFDWRKLNLAGGQGLTLVMIVLPATGLYCAAILIRGLSLPGAWFFDRNLLPVMGAVLPALALLHHSLISPRVTGMGWAFLAFFAGLGIAMTHDEIAVHRATLTATDRLTSAGPSRTCVSAGYEYDGWTQLLSQGSIILRPVQSRFWFSFGTPAVKDCYYVVLSPQSGLMPSEFEPVRYSTWLSPRQREVLIQWNPECNDRSCFVVRSGSKGKAKDPP
jgi:hypothetical protein